MKKTVHVHVDKDPSARKLVGALRDMWFIWVDERDIINVKGYRFVFNEKRAATLETDADFKRIVMMQPPKAMHLLRIVIE